VEVKSFFDIANNINSSFELLTQQQIEEVSNAFMLNRAMSNNFDTVFYSDEANGFKYVDLYSQYLFYFYSVNKKKRYGKWEKKQEKTDQLLDVMKFYNVSEKKALEYIEILSEEQLQKIKDSLSTGGKVGKAKK
jgi:hypothetical protein